MKKFIKLLMVITCFVMTLTFVGCEMINQNKEEITITYVDEEGNELSTETVTSGEEVELTAPDKTGHTFEGFYVEDEEIESPYTFEEDTTITVKYTANMYSVKFYVDDKLYEEYLAMYGSSVIYPVDPTKESSESIKYEFISWDKDVSIVKEDLEFHALFLESTRSYAITFLDDLGNIIQSYSLEYGATIEYPEDPVKAATNEFTYEFAGWDNDATVCTGDEVFKATFTSHDRIYTHVFVNENGEEIKSVSAKYGDIIEYPEAPKKEADAQFSYEFKEWKIKGQPINDVTTYVPVYTKTVNQYTYRFLGENDEVLKEETVDYGTMPVAPSNPQKDGYKFIGWDKDIDKVVCDVEYKAVFEEVLPVTSLEGLKVSILGDSISTFYAAGSEMNSYYSGTNQFYYPIYSATVKTVDLTWWYKLIKNNKMELGINNSWSGSCAYGTSSSAGQTDGRIDTIDENGMPDIVIIYLGTNDCASGFTTAQFIGAINTMVEKIRKIGNPDIFITTLGYSNYTGMKYSDASRVEYNEAIRNLAAEKDCGIVPLDEYIVDNSYMFYLGDFLHYNAKGADLLSKIYEKSIKEYYGIEYTGEIEVEYEEVLPEGVTGKVTVTSDTNFWGGYSNNVFLASSSFTNPQFSHRIELTQGEDGKYYVTAILKSGTQQSYSGDLVLVVSDSHENSKALVEALQNVEVGNIAEFDSSNGFPFEVVFKRDSDSPAVNPEPDPEPEPDPSIEGMLYVGAYNEGVWTKYENTVIAYSDEKMDKTSTYINFYVISLTADGEGNYVVSGLKPVNETMSFTTADYYILIFSTLDQVSFYNNAKVGQKVVLHGDITSGSCNLEFK